MLQGKNVILGVTGSIAAYKAVEIIRLLKGKGAHVFPVMTKSAAYFVHPVTFQSIAREKVALSLFSDKDDTLNHISLARLADLLLIAPATANIIGKIASGIADDILTTTTLATRAPIVIAPAMNNWMYENFLVQANIAKLINSGYRFIGPEAGKLACGDEGKGRMSEPRVIVDFLENVMFCAHDLEGKTFIITAGPTREPIDSVRFISNYSSGKMGFALAEEARDRGAQVILITGPTWIEPPAGVEVHRVETAREMLAKVQAHFIHADGLIMASAVSDFRSSTMNQGKIKKAGKEKIVLELMQNPDILEEIKAIKGNKIIVGFCAETENLVEAASEKCGRKNMDFVVANDVTEPGAGFAVDTNKVTIIDAQGGVKNLALMSKREVARKILDDVKNLLEKK